MPDAILTIEDEAIRAASGKEVWDAVSRMSTAIEEAAVVLTEMGNTQETAALDDAFDSIVDAVYRYGVEIPHG